MQLRVVACLPRIAVPPAGIDLGTSRIVQLPFEEWLALEGQSRSAVYDKLRQKYTRRPPAFWESSIDADPAMVETGVRENLRALALQIRPDLETLVAALHWYTGRAPIHPRRSVVYLDAQRTEDGVPRIYGESEKEYATENAEPMIVLRACDAAPLAFMLEFAKRTAANWSTGAYQHAIQSVALSSTPGLGWPARLLLLVGAFEALLLRDQKSDLKKDFSARFAALVAPDPGQVSTWTTWLGLAYRLRSDLVHARPAAATISKLPGAPEDYVATLERAGVVALCRLLDDRPVVHQWQMQDGTC